MLKYVFIDQLVLVLCKSDIRFMMLGLFESNFRQILFKRYLGIWIDRYRELGLVMGQIREYKLDKLGNRFYMKVGVLYVVVF